MGCDCGLNGIVFAIAWLVLAEFGVSQSWNV